MDNTLTNTMVEESENIDDVLQLVGFTLGEEEYCIDILSVQEINKRMYITRVPKAAPFVKGVVNLRGKVIPVIDLRRRFKLEDKFDEDTRLIVVELASDSMGFVVDSVTEVIRIPVTRIDPTPPVIGQISNEYLLGVGKTDNRLLILLDLNRVIDMVDDESSYMSSLERRIKVAHGMIADDSLTEEDQDDEEQEPTPAPKPKPKPAPEPPKPEPEPDPEPKPEPDPEPQPESSDDSGDTDAPIDDLIAQELAKREAEDELRIAQMKQMEQDGEPQQPESSGDEGNLDDLIAQELAKREAEDRARLERERQERDEQPENTVASDDSDDHEIDIDEDFGRLDDMISQEEQRRERASQDEPKKPQPLSSDAEPAGSVDAPMPATAPQTDSPAAAPDHHNQVLEDIMSELTAQDERVREINQSSVSADELENLGLRELTDEERAADEQPLQSLDAVPEEPTKDPVIEDDPLAELEEMERNFYAHRPQASQSNGRMAAEALHDEDEDSAQNEHDDEPAPGADQDDPEPLQAQSEPPAEDDWDIDTLVSDEELQAYFEQQKKNSIAPEPDAFSTEEAHADTDPSNQSQDSEDSEPEPELLPDQAPAVPEADEPSSTETAEAGQPDWTELVEVLDRVLDGDFEAEYEDDLQIALALGEIQTLLNAARISLGAARREMPGIIGALYDSSRYAEESTNRILDLSERMLTGNEEFVHAFEQLKGQAASMDQPGIADACTSMEQQLDSALDTTFEMMSSMEFQDITKQRIQKMQKRSASLKTTLEDMRELVAAQEQTEDPDNSLAGAITTEPDENDQNAIDDLLRQMGLE